MPDLETLARAQGYGWDEIDQHVGAASQAAASAGYSQDEIDTHLGFDPAGTAQRAGMAWSGSPTAPPDAEFGALNLDLANVRDNYANALMAGETRGPYDWADNVAAAGLDRMDIVSPEGRDQAIGWAARAGDTLAHQLPSRRDFTDAALDVSGWKGAGPITGPGMTAPGNIDLTARPVIQNGDGSISTVRSMSFNEGDGEILIPTTAANGSRILSEREAIEQYHKTGQFLGKFDTPDNATGYAEKLHQAQADFYNYDSTRNNLIDHWRTTGEFPASAAARSRVNSELGEKLSARPERGVLGEIGAGMARAGGSLVFGIEHIANAVEKIAGDLTDSDTIKKIAATDIAELARREKGWMESYQRGEGIGAFVEGTIGEAIPTIAEYLTLGIPRMMAYGALHGASAAWERTGSATAAATGALIGGAEAGAPAPFLHGAAGQGLVKAAVKGAIGMGAVGGISSVLDRVPDWVGGKGFELPTLGEAGEAAAAGAIVGAGLGAFTAAMNPRIKVIDPEKGMPDRVTGLDDPALQPNERLHDFASDLATKADQMERLRLENEGLVQGNPTESGGFFQRKMAEMQEARGNLKLVEHATDLPPEEGIGRRAFLDWRDDTGANKIQGDIVFSEDGKTVHVGSLRTTEGEGVKRGEFSTVSGEPNALGPRVVRDLARDFLNQHPEVEKIEGLRISGARTQAEPVGFTREQILGKEPAKQTYELAEGYRAAGTLRDAFDNWFGPIWRDESGSLKLFGAGRTGMTAADRESVKGQLDKSEQIIRRGNAVRDMTTSEIRNYVNPLFRQIEPHLGEWREALASKDADKIMSTKIGQMIAHLEGEHGAELPADHPLRLGADAIRGANLWSRAWMENAADRGSMAPMNFVKDYWSHLWKDPADAERLFGSPTGRRTTPTFREGIQAGLTPAIEHPIEHVMHDLTRKAHMWTRADTLARLAGKLDIDKDGALVLNEVGKPAGEDPNAAIVWRKEGPSQVKDGGLHEIFGLTKQGSWSESVDDPNSGKSYERRVVGDMHAYSRYAPVAKMVRDWNGALRDYPFEGDWMDKFNYASNTMLAVKLVVPIFHAITTTTETFAGALGNAFRELPGEAPRGFGDIAKTLTVAPKAREYVLKAMSIADEMGKLAQSTPDTWAPSPLLDALLTGGFRHGRRQGVYMPGQATHIMDSLVRGTLGREISDSLNQYGVGPIAHEAGRLATAASAPLFDIVIPYLKTGITVEAMETYIRQHPTASREELYRRARQIVDNTDDRMGELNMDNVFWSRFTKSILTKATISPGWFYGTIRQTAAALGIRLAGSRSGIEWNPTAATNLAGLVVAQAGLNMLYQYIKTGKFPGDIGTIATPAPWAIAKDLIAPRTGGTTKGWEPARAMLPGQQKEFFDWGHAIADTIGQLEVQGGGLNAGFSAVGHGFARYAEAKMRPIWGVARGWWTGQDAIGHEIAYQPGGWGKFLLDQTMPIFLNSAEQHRPASGLNLYEQSIAGVRETPDWVSDQRRFWSIQQYLATKRTKDELRRWRKERAYQQIR